MYALNVQMLYSSINVIGIHSDIGIHIPYNETSADEKHCLAHCCYAVFFIARRHGVVVDDNNNNNHRPHELKTLIKC